MLQLPLPRYDKSFEIMHPSKLEDYLRCERYFFYRNLLGWRSELPNNDLIFGKAMHAALEILLLEGYDSTVNAFQAFMDIYRKDFPEDTDEIFMPKNPEGAMHAITQYPMHYPTDLTENEVLMTEIAGTVPISEKRILHFRMDSILRRLSDGRVFSWDHKTKKGDFSSRWEIPFHLSNQTGTYTHCLYCMYEPDEVKGVEYNGVAFKHLKRDGYVISFKRVPEWRTYSQMSVWLWNVNDLMDRYEHDLECLSSCKESDDTMRSFPFRPTSCADYYGCPFIDFCLTWQNPLRECFEPPLGMKVEFYDPRDEESKHKVELKV